MRTVQIYINDKILDLFDDENIVVNSTIQNINDIAKVFTDFSQQFTVPATKRNNDIFQHYYNNDVDGTFQAKERQPARIDINFAPFRKGKIQLEGAQIVQNQAQHYVITFYGDVVSLKDLFNDDKLRDLDYTSLAHTYNYTNVKTGITSASALDVRYPLISSERVWQYGDATAQDISLSANAVNFTELFPAVRTAKIFEFIEDKYGVTFDGNFLTDARFTSLYTWFKNDTETSFTTQPLPITFNPTGATCISDLATDGAGIYTNEVRVKYVNLSNLTTPGNFLLWNGDAYHSINILIGNTSSADTYYIDVIKNGVVVNTLTGVGQTTFNIVSNVPNSVGLNDVYTFQARALNTPVNFDLQIAYNFTANYTTGDPAEPQDSYQASCSFETLGNVMTAFVNFNLSAPDITVSDFFSGILRMFNLTCYPLDNNLTFQVEPLEMWYRYGRERNITEFVDVKNIKVDRPKLYNNIEFNWKESKSLLNVEFRETNNRQYGGLRNYFGYDGGDFKIDLPFETLLFSKFTSTDLQVGYSLETEPDYKPIVPKCTQLYLYPTAKTVSFYLTDGSTPEEITTYLPFGQDTFYNLEEYTINFNEEVSSLTLDPEPNSLYRTYYQEYLTNLFSDKTRIVTVKCMLPLPLLQELELNDALIIRDKKYRINEQKVNLTNGEVELVLITDSSVRLGRIVTPIASIPVAGAKVVLPIKPLKDGIIKISVNDVLQPSRFQEENLTFNPPINVTGDDIITKFTFFYYDDNSSVSPNILGNLITQETIYLKQLGTSDYLLKEDDGFLLQENLFKIYL